MHRTLSEAQQSTCKSHVFTPPNFAHPFVALPARFAAWTPAPVRAWQAHCQVSLKKYGKMLGRLSIFGGQHMVSLAEAIGAPSLKRICLHFVPYDILWHFMNLMTSDLIATRPQWNEQSASPNASADQPWMPLEPCTSNNPDHGPRSVFGRNDPKRSMKYTAAYSCLVIRCVQLCSVSQQVPWIWWIWKMISTSLAY